MSSNSKKPWFKWYPSDWRGEPSLRLCSRAARSVWMDMLGLMHDSTLIGYLLLNGEKPTPEDLAKVLGDDIRDLVPWLEELHKRGVYSETPDGVIYSRKMVRDAERAEKGRADIGLRGGAWSKTDENTDRSPSRDPIRVPKRDPITLEATAIAKERKNTVGPGEGPEPTRGVNDYPDEFEDGFWKTYPRSPNMSKAEALKSWQKLKSAGALPDKDGMLKAVSRYRAFLHDSSKNRPTPYPAAHAATWLNQRRFEGFLETPGTPVGATPVNTGPGWEAAYPETWANLRSEFVNQIKTDQLWMNLFADCRAAGDYELICPTPNSRDVLTSKFGDKGERLPGHIFKAPVTFRYERPNARH